MSVSEIQQALKNAGFDPGPIDGVMGPRTKAAIRAYQQSKGLAVDGVAGPKTQASLQGTTPGSASNSVDADVASKYPQYLWALHDPELGPLVREAAQNGLDAGQLQGKLYNTPWWRTHGQAARNFMALQGSDPAEAMIRLRDLGSANKLISYATQMGVPMNMATALNETQRVVRGEITSDEAYANIKQAAKGARPHLAEQIDAGITVEQIFSQYRETAARELGISPDSIMLTDPKWSSAIDTPDGKRIKTLQEWQAELRNKAEYGWDKSNNGQAAASEWGAKLGKLMGVIG